MAEVLTDGDAGYRAAVAGLSVSTHPVEYTPAAVLRAADRQTVGAAVRWVRERGLRLRVRAGGHHLSLSRPGADTAVLDLSGWKDFGYDPSTRTAWLGTGLTSLEAARALARVGRGFPVGHAPTVGTGGFLLAGGHGWNPGGWGLASRRVVALELITAEGQPIVVDETSHPELVELGRGAGPFFGGVVTRFAVRTAPAPTSITRLWWRFRAAAAGRVGRFLDRTVPDLAPEVELTCFLHRRTGSAVLEVVATLFRDGGGSGDPRGNPELRRPLGSLSGWADEAGESSVRDLGALLSGLDPHAGEAMVSDQVWSSADYAELLPVLTESAAACPTRLGSVLVSTTPPGEPQGSARSAGPVGWRGVAAYGHWVPGGAGCDGTEAPHRRWARATVDRVPESGGSYVGEADLGRVGGVGRCFTADELSRLRTVTDRYTASGLFAMHWAEPVN